MESEDKEHKQEGQGVAAELRVLCAVDVGYASHTNSQKCVLPYPMECLARCITHLSGDDANAAIKRYQAPLGGSEAMLACKPASLYSSQNQGPTNVVLKA